MEGKEGGREEGKEGRKEGRKEGKKERRKEERKEKKKKRPTCHTRALGLFSIKELISNTTHPAGISPSEVE